MAQGYRTGSGRPIAATLQAYGGRLAQALGAELYQEADGIMTQSKDLVPVDTGALRASGYAELPKITPTLVSVELGYGGPATRANPKTGEQTDVYAIYVHENLEVHHNTGIAKFLELPFNQAKRGMAARLAAGVSRRMKTGNIGAGPSAEPTSESTFAGPDGNA